MTINENKLGLWKISENKGKGILDDDGFGRLAPKFEYIGKKYLLASLVHLENIM